MWAGRLGALDEARLAVRGAHYTHWPRGACACASLHLSHRSKDASTITKSIQTAMELRAKFPGMVAGFDLVMGPAQSPLGRAGWPAPSLGAWGGGEGRAEKFRKRLEREAPEQGRARMRGCPPAPRPLPCSGLNVHDTSLFKLQPRAGVSGRRHGAGPERTVQDPKAAPPPSPQLFPKPPHPPAPNNSQATLPGDNSLISLRS